MENTNLKSVDENHVAQTSYDAKNIQKLEGLEAVFMKPGMYIGSTDAKGKQHCFIEIVDNSVDEHNGGFCNNIEVELYEDDSLSVLDNGRGIPVDIHPEHKISAATLVVTELHAGGKFGGENSSYHRTGGLHGVGASVVNALSDWFEMTIYRNGKVYFQRFELKQENGKVIPAQPVADLTVIGTCPADKHGTKIHFKLNKERFSSKVLNEDLGEYETEYYEFNPTAIKEKLELLSFLNPSLQLSFVNHKQKLSNEELDKVQKESTNKYATISCTDDGSEKTVWKADSLINYLETLSSDMDTPVTQPIQHELEIPTMKGSNKGNVLVRFAMQWFMGEETKIRGFVNNIYTPQDGTHIDGFRRALATSVKGFVNDIGTGITEKDKKDFSGIGIDDIVEGLVAAVSIKIAEPQFSAQTKDKLVTKEALYSVNKVVGDYLSKYFEENPKIAKDVITRTLRAKRAREAAAKARKASLVEKHATGFSTPAKLADCQSNDPTLCELYLVEGDSAGGSAKMARDKKFQAILPLKGKILNVHNTNMAKVLASDEVNAIVSALGCGIGKHFDITKLRYHKIIYMTDADVDGQHIRTLLSTFFYNFLPELIKNKHVYMALPPLYRVKKKRGNAEAIYLKDDEALKQFEKDHMNDIDLWEVSRFKGLGEMNPEQLQETTMDIKTRELGLLEYDENKKEEIQETFDILMGDNPDKRKYFINTYKSNLE